jgi:hypothetical protein
MFPFTMPGGNPENAPTLVPILPVMTVSPSLLKAPTAVNTAMLDVVPRGGACAKNTDGTKNSKEAISAFCKIVPIIFLFIW